MSELPTTDPKSPPLMKCGCAAAGNRILKDGTAIPVCGTHDCVDVMPAPPDLAGRMARCAYHGSRTSARGSYGGGNECNYGQREAAKCTCEQPSSRDLPFFEYCGDGSKDSEHCKHCGYYEVAHKDRHSCRKYEARGGSLIDRFYCGCQGWD